MNYNATISQRKNNPRELWKLIKLVIPFKKPTYHPTKLLIENSVTEDPTELFQHFDYYFSEIGKTIAQNASNNTASESTF